MNTRDSFMMGWGYGRATQKELTAREIATIFPQVDVDAFSQGLIDGIAGDDFRIRQSPTHYNPPLDPKFVPDQAFWSPEDPRWEELAALAQKIDNDPAVCRLQFPDGSVPGNATEAAQGWHRVASEARDELRTRTTHG